MRNNGTTLLEVLLAVAMLALAMIPMFGLMSSSNTASRVQKIEGVAANLAKEEMNKWMYVFDPGNFPNDGVEDFVNGGPFIVEGNEVEIKVRVYRHQNTSTNVKYPDFVWHDFRTSCPGGTEGNDLDSKTNELTRTIEEVTKDSTKPRLIDIAMQVRWRTPNTAWSDVNRFFLLGRRGWM